MANTYTAFVDPSYSFEDRMRIGRLIIDYIKSRTKAGRGVGNVRFLGPDGDGKYSDAYAQTVEFKIAGKTKGRVNLTLSGDMLDSLKVVDAGLAGRVVIGLSGEDADQKATWMREKGYHFLGLSDDELNGILSGYRPPPSGARVTESIAPSIAQSLLQRLLRG